MELSKETKEELDQLTIINIRRLFEKIEDLSNKTMLAAIRQLDEAKQEDTLGEKYETIVKGAFSMLTLLIVVGSHEAAATKEELEPLLDKIKKELEINEPVPGTN